MAKLHLVETLDEANAFMRWLGERRSWLAVDTETEGFDWWRHKVRTIQFGDATDGWCIEAERWGGLAAEALAVYDGPVAMHNAKFDTHFLEVNGYPVKRHLMHDTRTMAHLADETHSTALKRRAAHLFGEWANAGKAELELAMMKGRFTYATVPIDLLWQYAAMDTVLTAMLAEHYWPTIAADFSELYDLELATLQVLLDMERKGCQIDMDYVDRTIVEWRHESVAIEHSLREEWGIANPTSRQQLAARMQEDGVAFVETTPTGKPSMKEDILDGIDHPIAKMAVRLFHLTKHAKTYLSSLQDLRDVDDVIHCNINPLGARTGRMSASRPPLQQLPRSAEIRDAFVPRTGNKLILADYDQIEMRLLAHFSGDTTMIAAIRRADELAAAGYLGHDLHSANARAIWHIAEDAEVPKLSRQIAKSAGFAEVYGAGDAKFAATVGTDLATARQFKQQYNLAFPGVNAFKQRVELTLRERMPHPYLVSPYGRHHRLDLDYAYRGLNYICQGTAADVLKDRLVAMRNAGLGEYMTLPIHDEIMLDVPVEDVEDVVAVLRDQMPVRDKFSVPLTVGVDVVDRWGDKYREG